MPGASSRSPPRRHPALVGHDLTMLIYPIVATLVTLTSWALRPPDRMLPART